MYSVNKSRIAIREASACYSFDYPYVIPTATKDGRPVGDKYRPRKNKKGYAIISFRRRKLGIDMNVHVHQIVAYQKYGEKIFGRGIVCRHLDGDPFNFRSDNVEIGTYSNNWFDVPKSKRMAHAIRAASFLRVLSDEQVIKLRTDRMNGMTFPQLAEKYGLSSSGHAHYIYVHRFMTKK